MLCESSPPFFYRWNKHYYFSLLLFFIHYDLLPVSCLYFNDAMGGLGSFLYLTQQFLAQLPLTAVRP